MDLTCIECFVATGCQNNSVRWATDLEGGQWDLCVFFSPNILSQRPRCKWCVYVCVCVRREVGVAVGVCGTGGTELQQCRRRPIGMWHAANHTQHLPKGEKDRKWEIESEVYKYINTYICMYVYMGQRHRVGFLHMVPRVCLRLCPQNQVLSMVKLSVQRWRGRGHPPPSLWTSNTHTVPACVIIIVINYVNRVSV